MPLIDSYTNKEGSTLELHHQEADNRWHIICWNADGELHWDIDYIVLGYVDGNPNRQLTKAFTEAEARAEFERWR